MLLLHIPLLMHVVGCTCPARPATAAFASPTCGVLPLVRFPAHVKTCNTGLLDVYCACLEAAATAAVAVAASKPLLSAAATCIAQVKFEPSAPLFAVHAELLTADGNICRVSVGNIFKAENIKACATAWEKVCSWGLVLNSSSNGSTSATAASRPQHSMAASGRSCNHTCK